MVVSFIGRRELLIMTDLPDSTSRCWESARKLQEWRRYDNAAKGQRGS